MAAASLTNRGAVSCVQYSVWRLAFANYFSSHGLPRYRIVEIEWCTSTPPRLRASSACFTIIFTNNNKKTGWFGFIKRDPRQCCVTRDVHVGFILRRHGQACMVIFQLSIHVVIAFGLLPLFASLISHFVHTAYALVSGIWIQWRLWTCCVAFQHHLISTLCADRQTYRETWTYIADSDGHYQCATCPS